MFPQGGPGVALLLLRISVVAFLLIVAANYNGPFYGLVLSGVLLISLSLLIGFLTPIVLCDCGRFSDREHDRQSTGRQRGMCDCDSQRGSSRPARAGSVFAGLKTLWTPRHSLPSPEWYRLHFLIVQQ